MGETILIVEDELSIVTLIKYNLEKQGFAIDVAFDGETAINKINNNDYSLVILDLMLPEVNGLKICETIRQDDNPVPILMLTALDQEEQIIEGLNVGADDYMTKPFSPKILIARIHTILRRIKEAKIKKVDIKLTNGDLIIYPKRFEAYKKEHLLALTKKEYDLLTYFVQNKGLVLSRDQLLYSVWDYEVAGDTRIVDVHVGRLRDKIEPNKKHPQYIQTIHGFGYKMESLQS